MMTVGAGDAVNVKVLLGEGIESTVRAFTTHTPGLVVYCCPCHDRWMVAHQLSGLSIASADDPETAILLAARLAPATDWTLSRNDMSPSQVRAVSAFLTNADRKDIRVDPLMGYVDRNLVAS